MARFFDVAEITVHDLNSLAEALFSIEKQSDKAVIRGSLHKDRWPPLQLPRTNETFQSTPRQWCMLDVDGLEWLDASSDSSQILRHTGIHL